MGKAHRGLPLSATIAQQSPACLRYALHDHDPADRKAAAVLLAAGVDLATEESLLGDLRAANRREDGVVPGQMDNSPGPRFTLDDLLTFHFLLMDDAYIQEFLEGHSS